VAQPLADIAATRQAGTGRLALIVLGLQAGLVKTRVKKKKPAQWVFGVFLGFFWGFLGFFGLLVFVFWVFWVFFKCLPRREFLGFFSFKNTFMCIQTLNYLINLFLLIYASALV
jgi:hypothetical protein